MSELNSELIEISKLNGDFKRNYGKLLGAVLYLYSIGAARARCFLWSGVLLAALSTGAARLEKHGVPWLHLG